MVGSDIEWRALRRFLPFDLDGFAVEHGALKRRRGVAGGEALLRTLLLCGLPKATLARASLLARQAGLGSLNATALFKRLCASESMLRSLFFETLKHAASPAERWGSYRLLAVDATVLCGPGATGADQRLHVVYDLGAGVPLWVDLTGPEGGETLRRHIQVLGRGDLVLGDRGYGHARGLSAAIHSGASFLIRFEFSSIRLMHEDDRKIDPAEAEALVPEEGTVEFPAFLETWAGPLRVIGSRNNEGKVVWLITDLSSDELPAAQARELYRRRWQIELFFKRMKSLLKLDELPTRNGPTARPWVWAKLLLATLAVLISDERFSPWGYPIEAEAEPMAEVRVRGHGTRQGAAPAACPQAQTRPTQRKEKAPRKDASTTHALEA
jgi:hypothetical protein